MNPFIPLVLIPVAMTSAYYGGNAAPDFVPKQSISKPVRLTLPSTIKDLGPDVITSGPTNGLALLLNNDYVREPVRKEAKLPKRSKYKKSAKYRLRALMIDGDVKLADIGGVLVKVGYPFGAYRVAGISEDGVTLSNEQGQKILRLR